MTVKVSRLRGPASIARSIRKYKARKLDLKDAIKRPINNSEDAEKMISNQFRMDRLVKNKNKLNKATFGLFRIK